MARSTGKTTGRNNNGSNLGFEEMLWLAADKLRGQVDASEYKHIVLGLVFLKYISDAFAERHQALTADPYADPEDPDEYLAEGVFWVPEPARWSHLQALAKSPTCWNGPSPATRTGRSKPPKLSMS